MKATLNFSLPKDMEAFDDARQGRKFRLAIEELDIYLRNKLKYEELNEEQYKAYDEVRSKLKELRSDIGILV